MQFIDSLKQFLSIKNNFDNNLVMSVEDEERFQLSNICWICGKLFNVGGNKVKHHRHITGKYRGLAHWSYNNSLRFLQYPVKKSSCNIS